MYECLVQYTRLAYIKLDMKKYTHFVYTELELFPLVPLHYNVDKGR